MDILRALVDLTRFDSLDELIQRLATSQTRLSNLDLAPALTFFYYTILTES